MPRNTKTVAVESIYNELNSIFSSSKFDFMPVVTKPITQHNGIEIIGTFRFNDPTATRIPPMCYVTVRRDATDPYPHNGLGFAFSKMSYSDTTSGIYNVYIVDNSALVDEVFMYNEIVLQENGVNNFLAAASRELLNNTTYRFKLRINEYNSARLWLLGGNSNENNVDIDTGLSESAYNSTSNYSGYLITTAPRYYEYEPQSDGTNFGIGVLGSRQGEWFFDDIQINSIIDNYPFAYYQIKIPNSLIGTTKSATLEWEGYGVWGSSPYIGSSGVQAWLATAGGSWEKIGEHAWIPGHPDINERKITKNISNINDYNIGNYCHLYVTTTQANSEAKLYTDYVHLSSVVPSGIHTGNMLDVYVKDTTKIARDTYSGIGSTLYLNSTTLGPIVAVRGVTNYNIELIPGDPDIGYLVSSPVADLAFSTNEQVEVTFSASTDAVIEYLYYTDGSAIQNFVNSDNLRYPGINILVKTLPPVIITINNLEYVGNIDSTTMRLKLIDYILGLTNEFDISKMLLYMQSVGATAFNLDTIDVIVEHYDYTRTLVYKGPVTTSYVLRDMGMFYTDTNELIGVIRV
ncbi:MAG: hypothetical protein ACP5N7_00060 [Candidatus Pacearchaeota archaeon]